MDYESIFDTFEERSSSTSVFIWKTDETMMSYSHDDFLYEGNLSLLISSSDSPKYRKYVLTKSALIKCKVRCRATSC